MALMLLAGLAGLTKGLSEVKEKKDEETKQLVAARTKTAYQNYLKHQEQVAALKEEVKKRDAEALQFQPDLNDEERVAIATMPNAIDLYKRALAEGRSVGDRTITLRDILKVGDKAKGMKYDDFVNALGKVEPVQQVMMEPRTGLFATSPEKQRRLMETMAGTVGVPTEQLMAFERPREAPRVEPMGALDIETMFKEVREKKIKPPQERLQERLSLASEAESQFGKDSPEAIAAKREYQDEKNRQETLNPKQLQHSDMINEAEVKRVLALRQFGANSPQYAAAQKEVENVRGRQPKETGGDLTHEQARKIIVNGGANAVALEYGRNPNVAISTDQFGVKSIDYIGDPKSAASQKIRATQLAAIARAVRPYLDSSGRPLYPAIRDTLMEAQVPFDSNGRPIFNVTLPPDNDTTPGDAPVGASRVTPGAAAPTTRPAAPAVAPAAGAAQPTPVTPQAAPSRIDIAAERKSANDAIAGGANREAVAKRFKERTGQNL